MEDNFDISITQVICFYVFHYCNIKKCVFNLLVIEKWVMQFYIYKNTLFCSLAGNMKDINRSSPPEVFLRKGVLKICCKFTGEYPCRSVISIKLQSFSAWGFSCKFAAYFQSTFSQEHLWRTASLVIHFWFLQKICKGGKFMKILIITLVYQQYI